MIINFFKNHTKSVGHQVKLLILTSSKIALNNGG